MKNKVLRIKLDDGTKIIIEGTDKEVKRIWKFLKQIEPKNENYEVPKTTAG